MNIIVITGAPGVGKTTVLPAICERLPQKNGFIDGDSVGRTKPLDIELERLNLIQDNIYACAQNFQKWGAEWFVAGFVLPTQEKIQRLTDALKKLDCRVHIIGLVADKETLSKRNKEKNESYGRDPGSILGAIELDEMIKEIKGIHIIDTTALSLIQVADKVVDYCGI